MTPTQPPHPLEPLHPGPLQIEDNLARQERIWRFERIGWVAIWLIMAAGLAGVFGGGPLSRATVGNSDQPLKLDYPRFTQIQTPTSLRLQVDPQQMQGRQKGRKTLQVWIDRSYLEGLKVASITPAPIRTEAGRDRLVFTFALTESDQPTAITFNITVQQMGLLQGQLGLTGEAPLHFHQLIYP
jgi:hypothetical protein